MRRVVPLLVLALVHAPLAAHAWQDTSPASAARIGDQVRVHTTGGAVVRGTLALVSSDLLVVADAEGSSRTVRSNLVRAVDARRVLPWRRRAMRGALVGATIGFLVPAVQSLARGKHVCETPPAGTTYTYCEKSYDIIDETASLGAVTFGILGFGVGAAVPWHHWKRVTFFASGSTP